MSTQTQDVFDLLGSSQAKPKQPAKPSGDIFDSLEAQAAPVSAPAPTPAPVPTAAPAPQLRAIPWYEKYGGAAVSALEEVPSRIKGALRTIPPEELAARGGPDLYAGWRAKPLEKAGELVERGRLAARTGIEEAPRIGPFATPAGRGAMKGLTDAAFTLAQPQNALLLAAMPTVFAATPLLMLAAEGYFTIDMATQALRESPEIYHKFRAGDVEGGTEALINVASTAGFAAGMGTHLARGGRSAIDRYREIRQDKPALAEAAWIADETIGRAPEAAAPTPVTVEPPAPPVVPTPAVEVAPPARPVEAAPAPPEPAIQVQQPAPIPLPDQVLQATEVPPTVRPPVQVPPPLAPPVIAKQLGKVRKYDPEKSLTNAILHLGGINPEKIKGAGTWEEWMRLPKDVRMRVMRKESRSGPDDMASQLAGLGYTDIASENDLLAALQAHPKRGLKAIAEEGELAQAQARIESLEKQLAQAEEVPFRPEEFLATGEEKPVIGGTGEVSFEFGAAGAKDVFDTITPEKPMPPVPERPRPVEEAAGEWTQIEIRRREQNVREAVERVVAGKGTWTQRRQQLGLRAAEVPISKPEIEQIVQRDLAEYTRDIPTRIEDYPVEEPQAGFWGGSAGARISGKQIPGITPAPRVSLPRFLPTPKPTPAPAGSVLAEAERITQAGPPRPSLLQSVLQKARTAPKRIETSLISEFTPLRELERQVYGTAGKPVPVVDLARKFEQVQGAPAKAQADVITFRRTVVDPIRDYANDFNSYLFLKRTEDRLVHNPEVKRVGDWSVEKARQGLAELRSKIGNEAMESLEIAGRVYQDEMNRALRLQVESGRMSEGLYNRIISGSDFYAPFKVLKYMESLETAPSGTGRGIATTEDLTEAITGIGEEDLHLGNILQASAEQIVRSRILAEKNLKMLELDHLADVDQTGELVKRAEPTRFFPIEYRPAEQILKQLRFQETAQHPQSLEQSFIKVGKAIQFAEEAGLKVRQRNLPVSLGRSTIGGVEQGGRISLNAFTSEVIAHELGHSFDVEIGQHMANVFGKEQTVKERLSSAINLTAEGKKKFGQTEFQKELSALVDYTGLGGSPKYRATAKERFAEFLQLYIHDPAKARELAPAWTDHFETQILPQQKVKNLVEKLAAFYQKVDKLPNIMTPLKELDDANYLELAIRRAFPDKPTQIGVRFGTKPAPGNDIVIYLKDGKKTALEVSKDVASAIEGLNAAQTGLVSKALAMTKVPLQWGATSANAAFQVVNLLFADLPRATLISRYGLRELRDVYQFPLDWAYSLYTSMRGNFGSENKLFMDWLKSGAANSTIQRELTPSTFRPTLGLPRAFDIRSFAKLPKETILDNIAKFSNAIEETSKILGIKRGMRLEGIDKLSPAGAAAKMQEIAAEVRNYSGSPDFLRRGRDTRSLNLLFMFFNARMQGAASDLARLAGKTGARDAGAAWGRLGVAIGVPATILALVNQSDDYRADYEKIPEWERKNYFMIPRDSFFVTETGDAVREYWRVPKREMVSLFGNLIESAVEFGQKRDPAALAAFSADALETLSPVNIQGKTPLERLESVVSSANPLVKTPVEVATGRDVFRHYNVVPEYMKGAPSEEQYRHTTPSPYVLAGQSRAAKVLGLSPLHLEQLTRSVTAGGLTQFAPGRPEVGRSWATTFPITKRFVRSGAVEAGGQEEALRAAEEKETAAQVRRRREALNLLRGWDERKASPMARQLIINQVRKTDPKLAEKLSELQNAERLGITSLDRQVLALGVESGARAEYIRSVLKGLTTDADRSAYLAGLRRKKILTPKVDIQLRKQQRAEAR